jgi:hypothetical protein
VATQPRQAGRMVNSSRGGRARPASQPPSLSVLTEGTTVTVLLQGRLDDLGGKALVDTLRTELDRGPQRIHIDMRGLDAFTPGGAASLLQCRDLATGLPDGLHYRTDPGPGQEALLAAFEGALQPDHLL